VRAKRPRSHITNHLSLLGCDRRDHRSLLTDDQRIRSSQGLGAGVGRGLAPGLGLAVGVGLGVGVGVAVAVTVAVGVGVAVAVAVGVGVGVDAPPAGATIATIIGEPVLK